MSRRHAASALHKWYQKARPSAVHCFMLPQLYNLLLFPFITKGKLNCYHFWFCVLLVSFWLCLPVHMHPSFLEAQLKFVESWATYLRHNQVNTEHFWHQLQADVPGQVFTWFIWHCHRCYLIKVTNIHQQVFCQTAQALQSSPSKTGGLFSHWILA